MIGQSLVVAAVVIGCTLFAVWTLLPAVARRGVARALLAVPWPRRAAAFWQRHAAATSASGCACDGCDQAKAKPAAGAAGVSAANAATAAPSGVQPIRFYPRAGGRR